MAMRSAREDTVLFPAFRELVSSNEYYALGEDLEKREHGLRDSDLRSKSTLFPLSQLLALQSAEMQ